MTLATPLHRVRFTRANLGQANLQESTLTFADLREANLVAANLQQADLSHANLQEAYLLGSNLQQAHIEGCKLDHADVAHTIFANIDLRGVHGLDTMRHWGPSTIGLDTIERSQGQIPEVFLRGCGVSERIIEYLPSLTAHAIDYYSTVVLVRID